MIAAALAGAFTRGSVIGESGDFVLTGGYPTSAGERVSPESAQRVAAVFAAVTLTTSALRAMPLRVLRDSGDEVLRAERESRLWRLLHDRPNPEMHAGDLWEWAGRCLQLRGNAFLFLERGPDGRVENLRPVNPGRLEVGRHPVTRRKMFVVHAPDDREQIQFIGTTDDILHIRGIGDDPLLGVSVVHYLREPIGRTLAEDRHAGAHLKHNARPSGILTVAGKLDDDRAERLVKRWEAAHGGARRSGATAVLEEGTNWKPVVMTAADLDFVKQRAISREDIAIAWQVPGDMLLAGASANLHYSSDSSRDVRLVKYAVMPWALRIQHALEICDLLPWGYGAKGRLVPRFDPRGLLKADEKTRAETYEIGLRAGYQDVNTVRRREDLEPIEGLDKPLPLIERPRKEDR